MSGRGNVRFSAMFAETVQAFGLAWARDYYIRKHGMSAWEFGFWCRAIGAF